MLVAIYRKILRRNKQGKAPRCDALLGALVRVTRLERAISASQMRRGTNSATPGYSISAIIPRWGRKAKIFLSVVIYVVKGDFMPLSATGESPVNAGAARLCGVSPCPIPDTVTALPNQARYQLRYTRISTGGAFAPPAYCTLLSARTQGGSETFFHPGLPPAGKTAPQASSASRRQTLTPAMARAKTNQKMLITRG